MPKPKKKGRAGAPIGNKNAVGNGRPANPGFSDEDLIILGEELILWLEKCEKENKEVVHLSEWYSKIKKISPSQWQSIGRRDCFIQYYERALIWMGVNILKNKNLSPTYGSRFLGIYFKEVHEYERKQAEHKIEHELQKKAEMDANKNLPPNDDKLDELVSYVKKMVIKE